MVGNQFGVGKYDTADNPNKCWWSLTDHRGANGNTEVDTA
jgi:hypothetical protein